MLSSPFLRNGTPYFVLAGQVHNSSAYRLEDMQTAWNALAALHANTAEVPVYWEQIERRPGQFDFSTLDGLIRAAGERNLHLVLLWFATWKNGSMQYAPEWIKQDPARYPRALNAAGQPLWVLSAHVEANWEADSRALCALFEHLLQIDPRRKVVTAIQIENEPGILGAERDHGPQAEAAFQEDVPLELLARVAAAPGSPLHQVWARAGQPAIANWAGAFGELSAEAFSAWSIARYIDRLAEAARAVFDLPCYVNAWLGENGWRRPGANYPSGGPVSHMLDLWKLATPHLDCLAPDIYLDNPEVFRGVCQAYQRPDNPLFVPESAGSTGNAINLFEAIAQHHAIGYGVFGVESLLDAEGVVKPQARELVDSFRIVSAVQPLIQQYWNTQRIHAILQREAMTEQWIDLGEYQALVQFDSSAAAWYQTDPQAAGRGRGLIFVDRGRMFYLAGAGCKVLIQRRHAETRAFSQAHDRFDAALSPYAAVEEGSFGPIGNFIPSRTRNGDEIGAGLWLTPESGVLRVRLAE
jgi:hypothetical protein